MVLINKAINEVTLKLVYYGPGLCGKTTNLEKIYGNPKLENKGKMISMATETDRTLFFDFMPMELGTINGQKIRVQLYTVPGQVFYDATRKLVLRGADGVVFVADSQASMRESNLDSLENLKTNLRINRLDPDKVALVLQYNKRDLPNVSSVEELNAYMNPGNFPFVEASAITGTGVTQTLRTAVARILENLKKQVDTTLHDQPELTAPDMQARSGVTSSSAGTPKLSMKTDKPAPPSPPKLAWANPATTEPETASPFSESAFDDAFDAVVEPAEDDPFGNVTSVAEPESETGVSTEDPFAASAVEAHPFAAPEQEASNRFETTVAEEAPSIETPVVEAPRPTVGFEELETMLASARTVVQALEAALERAREHERVLLDSVASKG